MKTINKRLLHCKIRYTLELPDNVPWVLIKFPGLPRYRFKRRVEAAQ